MPIPPKEPARIHESGLYLEMPGFPGPSAWRAGFTTLKGEGRLDTILGGGGWDPTPVWRLRQVHGNRVHAISSVGKDPELPLQGDGLATARRGLTLAVAAADCLPLILFDPQREAGAVLHAGWRGTRAGIAECGVQVMQDNWGCRPSDLKALLGPCIGVCCYQVGEEVISAFGGGGLPPSRIGVFRGRSFFLDLAAINQSMLLASGLPEQNIIRTNLCTHCRSDLFPSYRREGSSAGRFLAFLASRSPS